MEDKKREELTFIKEVAKYFMDFLETDFHKRRNPKRAVKLRNEHNLLLGLNLNKYRKFNALMWDLVDKSFSQSPTVPKGKYQTNIPQNLLELINFQLEKINSKQVNGILERIGIQLENVAVLHKDDYDRAIMTVLEESSEIIRQELTTSLIADLEKPLLNLDLGDENSLYLMEEELTLTLVSLLKNKESEVLKFLISNEKINIQKELKSVFSVKEVTATVSSFFEDFKVTDLFYELFELDRNKKILDKQEFYLYFGEIGFNKVKYLIFLHPF